MRLYKSEQSVQRLCWYTQYVKGAAIAQIWRGYKTLHLSGKRQYTQSTQWADFQLISNFRERIVFDVDCWKFNYRNEHYE